MKLHANGMSRLALVLSLAAALSTVVYIVTMDDLGKPIRIAIGRAAFVAGSNHYAYAEAKGFRFSFEEVQTGGDHMSWQWTCNGEDFFETQQLFNEGPSSAITLSRPMDMAPNQWAILDLTRGRRFQGEGYNILGLHQYRRGDGANCLLVAVQEPPAVRNVPTPTTDTLMMFNLDTGAKQVLDLPAGYYGGAGIFPLPGSPQRILISRVPWWTILDLETLQTGPRHPGLALQMSVLPLRDAEGQCTGFATRSSDGRYLHFVELDGSIRWTINLSDAVRPFMESLQSQRNVEGTRRGSFQRIFTEGQLDGSIESTIVVQYSIPRTARTISGVYSGPESVLVEFDQRGRVVGQPRPSDGRLSPFTGGFRNHHGGPVELRSGDNIRGYIVESFDATMHLFDRNLNHTGEVYIYRDDLVLNPGQWSFSHPGVQSMFRASDGSYVQVRKVIKRTGREKVFERLLRLRISPEPTPATAPR